MDNKDLCCKKYFWEKCPDANPTTESYNASAVKFTTPKVA
jgi:hypothetical protein